MPRPNSPRAIESETSLARRITLEREARELSPVVLAQKMGEAGCPISASAIYRIERADPPRRITVNELVALADVFHIPVGELLTPVELIEKERATELARQIPAALDNYEHSVIDALRLVYEYSVLAGTSEDLSEFMHDQLQAASTRRDPTTRIGPELRDRLTDADVDRLRHRIVALWNEVLAVAFKAAGQEPGV